MNDQEDAKYIIKNKINQIQHKAVELIDYLSNRDMSDEVDEAILSQPDLQNISDDLFESIKWIKYFIDETFEEGDL